MEQRAEMGVPRTLPGGEEATETLHPERNRQAQRKVNKAEIVYFGPPILTEDREPRELPEKSGGCRKNRELAAAPTPRNTVWLEWGAPPKVSPRVKAGLAPGLRKY